MLKERKTLEACLGAECHTSGALDGGSPMPRVEFKKW